MPEVETLVVLFIVLLVGAAALLIWLTVKTIGFSTRIEGLTQRLEKLEEDWRRLRRLTAAPPQAAPAAPPVTPAEPSKEKRSEPWLGSLASSQPPQAAAAPVARTFEPKPQSPPILPHLPSSPPALPPAFATEAVKSIPPVCNPEPFGAPAAPTGLNWEQFLGGKVLAWVGGVAGFLAVAYFLKLSFERGWIPPELRVGIGFLTGIGLLVGGFLMKRKEYMVTSHTLCATGVLILYTVTFACRAIYHFPFFDVVPTFLLMALITTTAFLLAVRMPAYVVAVLGMVGGFLTPVLINTGVDNPLGLFGYIALLNIGLCSVALGRRWHALVVMGAIGTVAMQLGWVCTFFETAKVFTAMAVFLGFNVLFLLTLAAAVRLKQSTNPLRAAVAGVSFVSLCFVFYLLTLPEISNRPPMFFSFILGEDLCLLAMALLEPKLHPVHLVSGTIVFLLLSLWTVTYLTPGLLNWALGLALVFAVLHAVFPMVMQRIRPGVSPVWWGHLFPPLALLLVMLPMFRLTELTWLLWPCVLLIDVLAIGLAALTASLTAIIAVLLLTAVATALWVLQVPVEVANLSEMLLIIGGFAVLFFMVGIFAGRKVLGSVREAFSAQPQSDPLTRWLGLESSPEALRAQIPALSAILPFLLLIMTVVKLPMPNPSPVFGLALLMVVLLLGLARALKLDALTAVGLACTLALEHAWYGQHFKPDAAALPLAWFLGFFAVFNLFPFLFRKTFEGRSLTWAVAALSGPAHFYLVYTLIRAAYPNQHMGLVPAAFAVPAILSLVALVKNLPPESPKRLSLLAWFGGVALFFITFIFPIQFERQWLTLGWALEGAALLWLFHRIPHRGLLGAGFGLLLAAFVRLVNPEVLHYHTRTTTPVLNWYLYTYGLVTLCLFLGAWLMRKPRNVLLGVNAPPLLVAMGAVLAFLLLNIEIADYFTPANAPVIAFDFSGNFGRDMTYTIAWALYALVLLGAGIGKQLRPARYAALGLLSVTLVKLFLHDLSQLEQLYRVAALVAVAAIALVSSFCYQRFFAASSKSATKQ